MSVGDKKWCCKHCKTLNMVGFNKSTKIQKHTCLNGRAISLKSNHRKIDNCSQHEQCVEVYNILFVIHHASQYILLVSMVCNYCIHSICKSKYIIWK